METKSHEDCPAEFPVVLTVYGTIVRDRSYLQQYQRYIAVDEGHRSNNLGCKLMKETKLTGKPLHVCSTSELWQKFSS